MDVELPTAGVLDEVFTEAVAAGADLDWSAIAEVTRRRAAGAATEATTEQGTKP